MYDAKRWASDGWKTEMHVGMRKRMLPFERALYNLLTIAAWCYSPPFPYARSTMMKNQVTEDEGKVDGVEKRGKTWSIKAFCQSGSGTMVE